MEYIKFMANLPGNCPRIISKIFLPLNVEVFKRKSNSQNKDVQVSQGHFVFRDKLSAHAFIYHLAGGKLGKFEGVRRIEDINDFIEEFKIFYEKYSQIYKFILHLGQDKHLKMEKEFSKRYLFRKDIDQNNYMNKSAQIFADAGQEIAIALIEVQSKWVLAVLKRVKQQNHSKQQPQQQLQTDSKESSPNQKANSFWIVPTLLITLIIFSLFLYHLYERVAGQTQRIHGPFINLIERQIFPNDLYS